MSSSATTSTTTPTGGHLDEEDYDSSARIVQYIKAPERLPSLQNNPEALLSAMYDFIAQHWLMSFPKASTDAIMREITIWPTKPSIIVELGTFVGVSAVFWGILLRTLHGPDAASKGCKAFALEISPDMAKITAEMIQIAGLDDVVEVILGEASETLKMLQSEKKLNKIDLLFLDHWSHHYVPDLQLCEELRLLHRDTVILADNVYKPGAPAYEKYVKAGGDGARGYRYKTRTESTNSSDPESKDLEWTTIVQAP